jgi:pyridoxal phosphate enzyme (YggS family)
VTSIHDNLAKLQNAIAKACQSCGRDIRDVTLVGAAKTKPAQSIRDVYACGVSNIGENYLQEARSKIRLLADLPITWHYIGAIQSNKTRQIAELFDWVHTLERASIAQRLSHQCPPGKSLNVLLQVNVDGDPAKAGVDVASVPALLETVQALPNLTVRGLMTILSENSDAGASYQTMAQLFAELGASVCSNWDTLSMGMTADMDAAIQSGATHIRIGTALFGARD